jgi:4-hydroxy-L-threonine phosphate dehydrogenase PdxA
LTECLLIADDPTGACDASAHFAWRGAHDQVVAKYHDQGHISTIRTLADPRSMIQAMRLAARMAATGRRRKGV